MVRIVLTNASFLKESGTWEDGELEITSRSVRFTGKKSELRKNFSALDQIEASVEEYERKKLFRKNIEKWLSLLFPDGTMWFFKFDNDHFADNICAQINSEREKENGAGREAELQLNKRDEIEDAKERRTEDTTSDISSQNENADHPETAIDENSNRSENVGTQGTSSTRHQEPIVQGKEKENNLAIERETISNKLHKRSEKPPKQKENKEDKQKANMMKVSQNLMAEIQALSEKAAKARNEADEIFDELMGSGQSSFEHVDDQKEIQSASGNEHVINETRETSVPINDTDDKDISEQEVSIGAEPSESENNEIATKTTVPSEKVLQAKELSGHEILSLKASLSEADEFSHVASTPIKEVKLEMVETEADSENAEVIPATQSDLLSPSEENFISTEKVAQNAITSEEKDNTRVELTSTVSDTGIAEVDDEYEEEEKSEKNVESGSDEYGRVSTIQSEEEITEDLIFQEHLNISFRKKFVHECIEFAKACTDYIPENRTTKGNVQGESYLFDLMNVCYSQMGENYEMYPMPTYIAPGGKLIKCREDGIYTDKLITAYEPFLNNATEHQNEVIRQSLNDCVGKRISTFSGMQLLCLMPDVVDDFSRFFRNQLEVNGRRLFQVPRSIALAYAVHQNVKANGTSTPEEFLCLDYDGEEFIAVKIRRETNKFGDTIFVRMGRYPVQGNHLSYKKLALQYLQEYMKKYKVPFTKKMTHDLVDTKLLQHLLLSSHDRPVLLTDGDNTIDIWVDSDILSKLQSDVIQDANSISRNESIPVYALCSFGISNYDGIWNVQDLENGCKEIKVRFDEGKTLWEEYLPSLQLGVHQDGTFADLDLISEKDRKQQISSAFLGKTIEIKINNGTIVLNKSKEYYDLPLVREVYGTMNKEKLARFQPEEEFVEDQEVELRIYYTYGDVDSYKLIAVCQDGTKIESEWVDTGVLANNPPHYTPERMSPMQSYEAMNIYNGFSAFVKKVKSPNMFVADTLYSYRRDETKPYSRYLRELNQSGFPYRNVRNYFNIDNQTSEIRAQIQHMLENGTFDCIADVLNKKLPENHDLEKGTSLTFPNSDQGDVLRNNLSQICCEFGMLYTLKHPSVLNVVNAMQSKKSVQFWAPITAYVKRAEDEYGVWDQFSKSLKAMKPTRPRETIFDLRAISNVCYLTEDWIFELYHGPSGKKDIEWIIENIVAVFDYEEWNKMDEYNAWRIRDVLELLLCICLLKSENPELLDCNDDRTKEIVKKVKKIDNDLRVLEKSGKLKKGFNSRIHNVNIPREFYKVNKIVYCLVQTLSGGESVNLVGFRDD